MAKFSRPIATAAAAVIATAGVVAPAHAATFTPLEDGSCKVTYTDAEKAYINEDDNEGIIAAETIDIHVATGDSHIEILEARLAMTNEQLKEEGIVTSDDEAAYATFREQATKQLAYMNFLIPAAKKCDAGETYTASWLPSEETEDSTTGDSKEGESSVDDGAKTGLIVAGVLAGVVGLIAAALPLIKQYLPANIAAMLP